MNSRQIIEAITEIIWMESSLPEMDRKEAESLAHAIYNMLVEEDVVKGE